MCGVGRTRAISWPAHTRETGCKVLCAATRYSYLSTKPMLQVTKINAFMCSPVGVLRDPPSVTFSVLKLTRINAAVVHGDILNEACAGVLLRHGPEASVVEWPDQVTRDRG